MKQKFISDIKIFTSQFKGGEKMAIYSYFYDSVDGDRPYSAGDFARAFGIIMENGVLIRETNGGKFGFDIGGANYTTIYEGKAVIEGRFVEVTGTEIITVPAGSYSGQVVIQVEADTKRAASIIVKTDRNPIQSATMFELPLYDVNVTDGVITAAGDRRVQGGAIPNNHIHKVSEVTGLQGQLDSLTNAKNVTWEADTNGIRAHMGKFAGTGKPVVLFLTSAQPSPTSAEHRVWIQIDKF
jgi:hypothetical protein